MKRFIRENPTIAFGLALPLLFVIVFALAGALAQHAENPPAYDLVYAENYNPGGYGLSVQVRQSRAVIAYRDGPYAYNNAVRLIRFSPRTGAVRELAYTLPPGLVRNSQSQFDPRADKIVPIAIPDLEALKLDNSTVAPDGYRFTDGGANYRGGLMSELFFSGPYSRRATLVKGWSRVNLPEGSGCCGNPHFIGWVIAP